MPGRRIGGLGRIEAMMDGCRIGPVTATLCVLAISRRSILYQPPLILTLAHLGFPFLF